MLLSVIFAEGFDAWHHGIPRDANSHRHHNNDAQAAWLAGWDQAASDAAATIMECGSGDADVGS